MNETWGENGLFVFGSNRSEQFFDNFYDQPTPIDLAEIENGIKNRNNHGFLRRYHLLYPFAVNSAIWKFVWLFFSLASLVSC